MTNRIAPIKYYISMCLFVCCVVCAEHERMETVL